MAMAEGLVTKFRVFWRRNASGTTGPNQLNVKGYFIYRVVKTQGLDFLSLSESLKALRIRPFLSRFLALNRPFLELNLGLIYLNLVLTIFTCILKSILKMSLAVTVDLR